MNPLKNLLIWFSYDENGEIDSIVLLEALKPNADLDQWTKNWFTPPFSGGGIDKIVKEHITVPARLMGVDGTAFVMYAYGKRFRAVMPYFVTLEV